jgi:hypothetical protein
MIIFYVPRDGKSRPPKIFRREPPARFRQRVCATTEKAPVPPREIRMPQRTKSHSVTLVRLKFAGRGRINNTLHDDRLSELFRHDAGARKTPV